MRVLIQSRKTLFTVPGGDTVYIKEMTEELNKSGIKVNISTELEPDLRGYDLVHIFNLIRPQDVYLQALNVKNQNKPLILTPIYIDFSEFEKYGTFGIRKILATILPYYSIEYLKILARAVKNKELHKGTVRVLLNGYFNLMRKVVHFADFFFPNSEMEMERLKKDFSLNNVRYFIVPNGIDTSLFDYQKITVSKDVKEKLQNAILCVSNIAANKNQLNLVKALKNTPFKLCLIGGISPNHKGYFARIKKEMGTNVEYLGHIPHEKLPQYYKAAKVHVLPSWFETTGLVSLEAAVMKCNIVITDKGYTREYFKDYAFYCEPGEPASILNAVVKAFNTPYNENLRRFILNNFTREKAAKKMLEGYEKVMRLKK